MIGCGVERRIGEGLEEAPRIGPIMQNRSRHSTSEMDIMGPTWNMMSDYTVGKIDVGRSIFFPINAPGMGRLKLFDVVGYS